MIYRQVIVLIKRTFFILICLFLPCITPIFAQNLPQVSAKSAVVYDPLDGSLLFALQPHERRGIASTTKIMTALVALEQYNINDIVTVQPEWCGSEGSSIYLKPGEQLQIRDLLYGLLLESGNDAAVALAGLDSEGAFVQKMNDKAHSLGLTDTHFDNPSGLDGKTHYSTAYELAQIAAAAMDNPIFAKIVATKQVHLAGRTMENHNRLLEELDACGVKTGYTKACGRCLVTAKEENGRMLICVTLNDPNDWKDHKALLSYGFSQLENCDLIGAGDCGSVPLINSEKGEARLYCNESFSCELTPEQQKKITVRLYGPRFVYGSVEAGSFYGMLRAELAGKTLFEAPVYFANTSKENTTEHKFFNHLIDFIIRRREH